MTDLVSIQNNQVVVSSRQVAEHFEKEHRHVLESIRVILTSAENSAHLFHETTAPDSYGREQKIYLMNRDGFSLLAMGFTGLKALQWKLKYIEAFNEMEDKLKKPALDEDFERRKIIGELIRDSDNESRPYILQLFKDYLPEQQALKPLVSKGALKAPSRGFLVIKENKFADFLKQHSYKILQINRGTRISRTLLTGLYYDDRSRIRISTVERLCNFLNCEPDELFICE